MHFSYHTRPNFCHLRETVGDDAILLSFKAELLSSQGNCLLQLCRLLPWVPFSDTFRRKKVKCQKKIFYTAYWARTPHSSSLEWVFEGSLNISSPLFLSSRLKFHQCQSASSSFSFHPSQTFINIILFITLECHSCQPISFCFQASWLLCHW